MPTGIRLMVVSTSLGEGGAERFCSTLLNGLDRKRFQPTLVVLREPISYPLEPEIPRKVLHHTSPLSVPRTVSSLRTLIRETKADVVLSAGGYPSLFVGQAISGLKRPPRWIARVGNDPKQHPTGPMGKIARLWLRRLYPRTECVVANSTGLARDFAALFPRTVRVHSVFNPVDIQSVRRLAANKLPRACADVDPETPVCVAVGRLVPQKRPELLLDAFQQVHAVLRDRRERLPQLWFAGEGPLLTMLRNRTRSLDLEGWVQFLGFCTNPYPILQRASVYALTSDHEGLPNALIEAQALGVPAVATRCPYGPDEIIEDGVTGFLVAPGDAKAIAAAILSLLGDPNKNRALSEAAAVRAQREFDGERIVAKWAEILEGDSGVGDGSGR